MAGLNATPEPVRVPKIGDLHLGKEAVKKDKRNLKFADYVNRRITALPAAPSRVRRSDAVPSWPMYANDSLPDCTIATCGHMEQLWSAVAGSPETPAEQSVLEMFDATGPRDEGRYELDVLNYWRKTGFGPAREKILAFVQINPKNDLHMQLATWLFGGVYAGIALPTSAVAQTGPTKVWTAGRGANGEPGSWGGHAVPIVNYWRSRTRYACITWGFVQVMTFGFWHKYGDEAYAIISPDWINKQGDSPVPGFNLAKLQEDLKALAG